jgi:hypothetical protein
MSVDSASEAIFTPLTRRTSQCRQDTYFACFSTSNGIAYLKATKHEVDEVKGVRLETPYFKSITWRSKSYFGANQFDRDDVTDDASSSSWSSTLSTSLTSSLVRS